jgi:hypothetical protein
MIAQALPAAPAPLITAAELVTLPAARANHRVALGDAPSQLDERRVPDGPAPHPVGVFDHGGAWTDLGTLRDPDPLADPLKTDGIASWIIEFLRIGGDGRR